LIEASAKLQTFREACETMSIKAPAKLHVEKEKEEEEDPDKDLSPGLRAYRQLSSKTLGEQSLKEQRILRHMEEVRAQVSSRIQHVGKSLEQHFRSIPVEQLTAEIAKRFKYYDKDGNGTLDRYEIIEAMAEMGSRPSETEVNEFFALFDTVILTFSTSPPPPLLLQFIFEHSVADGQTF